MRVTACLLTTVLFGKVFGTTIGLVGGEDKVGPQPYAAFVAADGTLTPLSGGGFPSQGFINSVGMNNSGMGIIGGQDTTGGQPAYASLVAADGTLTQLGVGGSGGFPSVDGEIFSVAINNAGTGIIGGSDLFAGDHPAYAALVAPDGTLTQLTSSNLPITNGRITSVGINSFGEAIMGGIGPSISYAALVAPDGTVSEISGIDFSFVAYIFSAAISDSGLGLITGYSGPNTPYVAHVDGMTGVATQLFGGNLPTRVDLGSAVINKFGTGIIGGLNLFTGYAALVAADGTLTQLLSPNFPLTDGAIVGVAINSSGVGLIGGGSPTGGMYAAFMAPDGTLTELSGGDLLSASGVILSTAIAESGVGLIGGEFSELSNGPAYLALVAPNGTVTVLSGGSFPFTSGIINSVALIAGESIISAITPQSVGSYTSVANTHLAATYALESHLSPNRRFYKNRILQEDLALVADARRIPEIKGAPSKPYTVWTEPFGDRIHQKSQGAIPSFTNTVGGVLAGFDYMDSNFLVGGALGYAYNYYHLGHSLGHGNIQEEMASIYGTYSQKHLWINATVWGGFYELHSKRYTLATSIVSKGNTHGWVLSPHLEAATPFKLMQSVNCYKVEPFGMLDWVNAWQHHYTETGSSGLNLVVDGQYNSLLRSEAGIRFYEELYYSWGTVSFKEKLSYVNLAPFQFNNTNTAFVSSISSFPVATGSNHVQNLGGAELSCLVTPAGKNYPYVSIDLQADMGSAYQSYFASLEIGKSF